MKYSRTLLGAGVMALMSVGSMAVFMAAQTPMNGSTPLPTHTTTDVHTADEGAQAKSFEVASLKLSAPGGDRFTTFSDWGTARFRTTNATLMLLLGMAYNLRSDMISGAPRWAQEQRFDIDAKVEDGQILTNVTVRPCIQQLLKERLHLATHHEIKDMQGYALVPGKNGPKLQVSKGANNGGHSYITRDQILAFNVTLDGLASMLMSVTNRPVANKTGIEGSFDIKLDYAPVEADDSSLPSVFSALQEQLGLKLVSQKVSMEILVVDHVDRVPTEN